MSALSTRTCKLTMTALRLRSDFLENQFLQISLFLLQLFSHTIRDLAEKSPTLEDLREIIQSTRTNEEVYNTVYNVLTRKFSFLANLIETIAETKVELLKLHGLVKIFDGTYVPDPIHSLFLYVLKILYIAPSMLSSDDAQGTSVSMFKQHLKFFLDEMFQLDIDASQLVLPVVNDDTISIAQSEREDEFAELREQMKKSQLSIAKASPSPPMKIQLK